MFATCDADSYFSRSDDEVWSALNGAGQDVYNAVCNENGGMFIKFDTTSITLTPDVNEIELPIEVSQILHLAERLTSTEEWHEIVPASLNNILHSQLRASGILSLSPWEPGQFSYYGPYLDSAASVAAVASQKQKIRISPAPADTRFVQLVSTIKWLQILNASSTLVMPSEGTNAMERFASAKLVRKNGDLSLAAAFEAEGTKALTLFLTWVRARQMQEAQGVAPYLDGE